MAYTDADAVTTYLKHTGTADDTLITTLIGQAQAIIDTITGRTFEASSNTSKTFDSERDVDGRVLFLDYDLASINSITNGDATTVTASEYTTEPRNVTPYYAIRLLPSANIVWEPTSGGDTEDAITISGKWAYSETAPDEIVWATTEITSLLYRQRETTNDANRTVVTPTATLLPAGVSELTRDTLARLTRRV